MLEKTLESPLDCKEIEPVNPKANQSWTFIGRTDAEVEAPILWTPDVKRWLFGKDPGKDWRHEEMGTTEDEMVGWHHRLDGHEFEQTPGGSEGQGSLECCRSWDYQLNNTELKHIFCGFGRQNIQVTIKQFKTVYILYMYIYVHAK